MLLHPLNQQVQEDNRSNCPLVYMFLSIFVQPAVLISISAAPQHVDAQSVSALCVFLRERRPLLASLPPPVPQDLKRVPYTSLSSLRANMLVNILLRVRHAHMSSGWRGGRSYNIYVVLCDNFTVRLVSIFLSEWREEAESRCRSARHSKVVLTVEQADGQQGVLLLWGASRDWLPRFTRDSGILQELL